MDENTKCVLVFLIAVIGIGVIFYLLRSQGGSKGKTFESVTMSFSRAKTIPQMIFAFFACFWVFIKAGALGVFVVIAIALINGVVAICGQNSLPFCLEILDRVLALFTNRPVNMLAPAPPT
jgi:hypothetical protein